MTKQLLIIGDLHAADKTPVGRKDDYLAAFLNKLDQILAIYEDTWLSVGPDLAVVFLGDIFHKKRPNHVSHFLVNLLQNFFDSFHAPPYVLVGNHDVPLSTKGVQWYPIGSLHNIELVDRPKSYLLDGETQLLFYPGHIEFSYDLLRDFVFDNPFVGRRLLFVHNAISEVHMPFHYLQPKELLSLGVDDVIFGHIHSRYGPKRIGSTVFFNPGAIMRISRAASDLQLQPCAGLVDLRKKGLDSYTVLDLDVAPAYDVFDVAELAASKALSVERSRFIESLDAFDLQIFSSTYLVEQIRRAPISSKLEQLILTTLAELEDG